MQQRSISRENNTGKTSASISETFNSITLSPCHPVTLSPCYLVTLLLLQYFFLLLRESFNNQFMEKILVIGCSGQIGSELTLELRKIYGESKVIATDIRPAPPFNGRPMTTSASFANSCSAWGWGSKCRWSF